jgi:Domain of unknown function (DUF383)
MLLANLAKSDSLKRIIPLKRAVPKPISESSSAMDQLMDCFVKGAEGKVNKAADFDYLAYFFADVSKVRELFYVSGCLCYITQLSFLPG